MEKRVELLAPCGSYESFLAAINAGADAVYLGGKQFGARAYAENFSEEELISVIRQAHLFGVKVYLTVNTLVKEREFSTLYDYLLPLYEAGLDGVIVQDMGVFQFIKRNFPECNIHASTQMTITSAYGAAYLKNLGCDRIVPARELALEEIREIKQEVSIEVEAFIHGAMCYCYSGQCLMSSMIGGRSGNRGRCAGPCRLPYKTAGKEGYFLSLKDMNTLEQIPELIEAGIDSFKIEGRMKKPEYVAGVVSVYRKYIDRYYLKKEAEDTLHSNTKNSIKNITYKTDRTARGQEERHYLNIEPKDKRLLAKLYLRSETGNGYYSKSRGWDMLTLQKPGYNEPDFELLKELRETYIRELPKMELDFYIRCKVGEPLYGEVRFLDIQTKKEVSISVTGNLVQKADKRAVSEEEIRGQIVRTGGTPFVVKKCVVELEGSPFVPMGWVKELRRELIQKVYEHYGARTLENPCSEQMDGNAENSVSKEIPNCDKEVCCNKEARSGKGEEEGIETEYSLHIMVQTKQQFEVIYSSIEERRLESEKKSVVERKSEAESASELDRKIRRERDFAPEIKECLIVDADLLMEEKEIRDRLFGGKVYWGIKCPLILRKSDKGFLKKLQAVIEEGKPKVLYCATMDALAFAKSISYQGKIVGEASLYAWNKEAALFLGKELDKVSAPLELDSTEIRELCAALEKTEDNVRNVENKVSFGAAETKALSVCLEAPVYGRVPFMVTANCIKLSLGQCDKNRNCYAKLEDRMGHIFPVYTNCSHCYNVIYNDLPTSYHENLWMLLEDGIRAFRIEFTTENGQAAAEVLQTFRQLFASELRERGEREKLPAREKRKRSTVEKKEQTMRKIAGMETTQGRFRRCVE